MFLKTASLLLLSGSLFSQTPSPLRLDVFFDPLQRALRPAIGSPGASYVGPAVEAGVPLSLAESSPTRNYLLAVAADSGDLLVLKAGQHSVTSTPVNAPAHPDKIALSPAGASAVLLYLKDKVLIVLTGLPDSPRVIRSVALGTFGTSPGQLAVSDDGSAVAVSFSNRTRVARSTAVNAVRGGAPVSAAVLYVDYSGVTHRITDLADVSAITFLDNSREALLADGAGNRVLRIHPGSQGPELKVLAANDPSQGYLMGLGVSPGSGKVFVVSASGRVMELDSAKGELRLVASCGCQPEGMYRMPGTARFRFNKLPADPIWMFDAASASAFIAFIPVDSETPRPLMAKEN